MISWFLKDMSLANGLITYIVYMLYTVLICIISTVFHELGHVLGGLVSGYRFVSFTFSYLNVARRQSPEGGIRTVIFIDTNEKLFASHTEMSPKKGVMADPTFVVAGGVLLNVFIGLLFIVQTCIEWYSGGTVDHVVTLFLAGVTNLLLGTVNWCSRRSEYDGSVARMIRMGSGAVEYNRVQMLHEQLVLGKRYGECDNIVLTSDRKCHTVAGAELSYAMYLQGEDRVSDIREWVCTSNEVCLEDMNRQSFSDIRRISLERIAKTSEPPARSILDGIRKDYRKDMDEEMCYEILLLEFIRTGHITEDVFNELTDEAINPMALLCNHSLKQIEMDRAREIIGRIGKKIPYAQLGVLKALLEVYILNRRDYGDGLRWLERTAQASLYLGAWRSAVDLYRKAAARLDGLLAGSGRALPDERSAKGQWGTCLTDSLT